MSFVTRFAPSPTGLLHIGNLRAAVMCWLSARKAGGQFILRIDDTDTERSREAYVEGIKDVLTWLGMDWDQFHRQSARLAAYHAAAERLRASGRLYACYETSTELELRRKVRLAQGLPPVYDRAALRLTEAETAKLLAEGRRPHWRFKLSAGRVEWHDGIRGHAEIDLDSLSDPVLIREDGQVLYTLASVVDDIDMGVTQIIRGEDHVANTGVQIDIFRALGAEVPQFAHHSLMVGRDGNPLSKREGALSVESFRQQGIEPLAMMALLARLGSSLPVEPVGDVSSLIAGFDLPAFGRAPARFDMAELTLLSQRCLALMPFAAVAGRVPAGVTESLWLAVRANLEGGLADMAHWLAVTQGRVAPVIAAEDVEFAQTALSLWTNDWKAWSNAVASATGRKGKALFLPLRRLVTGRDHGPEMAALLPLLTAKPGQGMNGT